MTSNARLAKIAALAMASAIAVPAIAGAVVLPDLGPIPMARPASVATVATPMPVVREVIQISATAQELPDARRNVRVVGGKFLPDASEEIDFAATQKDSAAVGYAEWLVMTTVQRMFETADEDRTLQVASNEVQ